MQSCRIRAFLAAGLAIAGLAATALAHGGIYQPPPVDAGEPPPPPPIDEHPRSPNGGPPQPGGDTPTPGGPDAGAPKGPSNGGSGGGGPSTGGGGGTGPATGGRGGKAKTTGAVPADHWTRWWSANRASIVDVSGRVREREITTPSSAAAETKPRAELWRAEAQEALTLALSDPDDDVASGAAIAIGKAGDPGDAPPLVAVLANAARGQQAREAAALGLGLLPPETSSGDVRAALERVAADASAAERLRGFAVYALGLRGDAAAVPFLLDSAQSNGATWDVAAAGASALGLVRCPVTRDELERLLAGPKADKARDAMRRCYAAHGLARLGDHAAVGALTTAATDEDPNVRRAAILALGALARPDDDAAIETLIRAIRQDKDRACRNMAAVTMGRIGPECAGRELRSMYDDGDALEQPFAALGLGLVARGRKDADGMKTIRRDLAESGPPDLRGALCIALGLAGDVESAPILRKIASERGDPELRANAAAALGLVGDRAGGPQVLREMLRDASSPNVQREAACALGMLGDGQAVTILAQLVADGSSVYVQGSAAVALGRIGGQESAASLAAMLRDAERPGISRAMAAVALGLILDRTEGRRLAAIGADVNWFAVTPTVREILDIL